MDSVAKIDINAKAAVLRRTQPGGHELVVSDGVRQVFPAAGPAEETASAAWSPDGQWLGLLQGSRACILDRRLNEVWSTELGGPPVCSRDWRETRLFAGCADDRIEDCDSFAPVRAESAAEWQVERKRWAHFVPTPESEARGDTGEVALAEAVWLPGRNGDLMVRMAPAAEKAETDLERLLILRAHQFAGAPRVELPVDEWVGQVRWADQANSVAWVGDERLNFWRYGDPEIRKLFQWRSPLSCHWVELSPNGVHVLVVLSEYDLQGEASLPPHLLRYLTLIIRTADGAAIWLEDVPGVDIAAWDGDDEISVAHNLQPREGGGYQYQWQQRIYIPELPEPWRLPEIEGAHPLQPPALTPVLHQGHDYSHVLPVLPEFVGSAPAELVLAAPVPGGLITHSAFGPDEAVVRDALVIVWCGHSERYVLIAVSPATARLRPLLSFDLPELAWPYLWLTIRPVTSGSRDRAPSFPVPVIRSAAAFECAAPDVATVAFWVG